ncbi:MAG TPA: RDD family protein [Blastocatellia bacterium]|nr:RDD family protein [Blastocatellia bacterium]
MKCENCGSELVGGAIVCRQCKHNNAQGRVSQWRARRTGELPSPTRTISPLADAAKPGDSGKLKNSGSLKPPAAELKPLEPGRSNSLPFEPKVQIHQTAAPSGPLSQRIPRKNDSGSLDQTADQTEDLSNQPVWRAQLKDRVKQSRERKLGGPAALANEPDEADMDPNPLVESALKRIRWASHTPSAMAAVRVARHGSQAAALAAEPDFAVEASASIEAKPVAVKSEAPPEVKAEPKPTARVTGTPTNPLLARKPATQSVNPTETKSPRPFQPNVTQAAAQAVPPPPTPPPLPKAPAKSPVELRVEIQPPPKTETKPVAENKPAAPKPRITGDLKFPAPPSLQPPAKSVETKPAVERNEKSEKSAPVPVQKPVESKIVEPSQFPAPKPIAKSKPTAKDRPATMWVRTLAAACDFEVLAVAYLPLFASYATLNPAATLSVTDGRDSLVIMVLLLATLTFCYQLLTLTLADRTSGMAFLNLHLVNIANPEKPVLFTQKFARAVAATAVFLCPLLNLISNQRHHTLPDMFSGTTLLEK